MRIFKTLLAVAVFCAALSSLANADDPIAIIVNKHNPVSTLSHNDIRKIYRNNILKWSDGTPVILYDLGISDPVREKFSKIIFNLSPRKIAQRWAHLKITNQAKNPPLNMKSQRLIIRRISVNKGAIGYVSLSKVNDANSKGVKVVTVLR